MQVGMRRIETLITFVMVASVLLSACIAVPAAQPATVPHAVAPNVSAPAGGVSGFVVPQGAVGPEAAPMPESWPSDWYFPKPYEFAIPKDGHAYEKHGEAAEVARKAVDPKNKCEVYQCVGQATGKPSILRTCYLKDTGVDIYHDGQHNSFQPLFFTEEGVLMEGTAYIMRRSELEAWKSKNHCKLVKIQN